MLTYVWQYYFPRLPFMNDIHVRLPALGPWFKDWAGRFGWGDYELPVTVKVVVAIIMGALLVSC